MTGLFCTLINRRGALCKRTWSSEPWAWLPGLRVGCVTLGELPDAISPVGSFSGLDKMI